MSGAEPLHLIKLAVGIRDVAHLREVQRGRLRESGERPPRLRHRTRNRPVRAGEVLAGGSMYWVIRGVVAVRQRILDIEEDTGADGRKPCAIVLDPELVATEPRPHRPFQGWRYLAPGRAPPDRPGRVPDDLPPALERDLRELGLL